MGDPINLHAFPLHRHSIVIRRFADTLAFNEGTNGCEHAASDTNHGHTSVTADYPNDSYHYHITADSPYVNGGKFFERATPSRGSVWFWSSRCIYRIILGRIKKGMKLKEFEAHIIGLACENMEPGLYLRELVDKTYQISFPAAGIKTLNGSTPIYSRVGTSGNNRIYVGNITLRLLKYPFTP